MRWWLAGAVWLLSAWPGWAEVEDEYWARLFFGGRPVGFYHSKTEALTVAGEAVFQTSLSLSLALARAGTSVEISVEAKTLEGADGKVRDFSQTMRLGAQSLVTRGTVRDGQVRVTTEAGEKTYPYPVGAIGPRALDRAVRRPGMEAGMTGEAQAFDLDNPAEGMMVSWEVLGPESKEVMGRVYEAIAVLMRYGKLPNMPFKVWGDAEGNFIAGQMPLGGLGMLEMVRAPREVALGQAEAAEIFSTSLVVPDRPLGDVTKLKQATFRLRTPEEVTLALTDGVGQSVVKREPGLVEVRVEMLPEPEPGAVWELPVQVDGEVGSFLASTRFLDWQDPAVKALAAEIVGEERNALVVARRIQGEVYRRIKNKNLATGFARASEVARTLSGDCTEHAVLAAAVARAVGLPARVVSGLVHAPDPTGRVGKGIFGFHMWAEVMVGPELWWPIDPSFNRFDPTHIAFSRSDLHGMNPELEMGIPILDAIGRVQLEVVELE